MKTCRFIAFMRVISHEKHYCAFHSLSPKSLLHTQCLGKTPPLSTHRSMTSSFFSAEECRLLKEKLNFEDNEIESLKSDFQKYDIKSINEEQLNYLSSIIAQHQIPKGDVLRNWHRLLGISTETLEKRIDTLRKMNLKIRLANLTGHISNTDLVVKKSSEKESKPNDKSVSHVREDFECKDKSVGEEFKKLFRQRLGLDARSAQKMYEKTNRNVAAVESKINLLLNNGVSKEDIIRRPYVINFRIEHISERLDTLKEAGISNDPLRYVCRSNQQKTKTYEILKMKKDVLGDCKTNQEFLCKYLGCSENDVNTMIKRKSCLIGMSPLTIKKRIDLFKNEFHFSVKDIVANPHMFSFSEDNLREKAKVLEEAGLEVKANAIVKAGKHFLAYLEKNAVKTMP